MDTVVLTTLLFNTTGILVFALGMVLAYCLPNRHKTRPWVAVDADVAARPVVAARAKNEQAGAAELPHAA